MEVDADVDHGAIVSAPRHDNRRNRRPSRRRNEVLPKVSGTALNRARMTASGTSSIAIRGGA
jgi:hypothetical protein